MKPRETELLLLIFSETKRVESLNPHRDWFGDDKSEWLERSTAIKDLSCGLGVRVRGDWLGTDAASRKARQRGLESLERSGLVKLGATWGSHRTHALLTPEGRTLAERMEAAPVIPAE